MATATWRSIDGVWSLGTDWFNLVSPQPTDTVVLQTGTAAYTSTVDVGFTVAGGTVGGNGVTLDIASTLTVTGALAVGTGATVDLPGTFAAGTLDLSGGGVVLADGGTLAGATLLGFGAPIIGSGSITNQGSIGWTAAESGDFNIGTALLALAGFDNTGQLVLSPGTTGETQSFVTGVTVSRGHTVGTMGELSWIQTTTANLTLNATSVVNSGTLALDGGTLSIAGPTFDNSGTIRAQGVATQSVQPAGTSDGIVYYGVVDGTLLGQVTVGTGVTSFRNTGTIAAANIEFQRAMTLSQLGTLIGGVTFDAGLDLGGGTLTAPTLAVGGLIRNGTLAGTGTLTLLPGATLDNVGVGPGLLVQTTGTGPVLIVDPPASGTVVTLDAVVTELDFRTVGSFDGGIAFGPGATNDVIGVFTPGGVTLGPDFNMTNDVAGSFVSFGGGSVLNDGSWSLDGSSLEITSTLDGSGTISLTNGATIQIAQMLGSGAIALNNGAVAQIATITGATPLVTFGDGSSQLVLPGTGAIGAVLAGLAQGDIVDFASVSSTPDAVGQFGTGAADAVNNTLDLTGASGDTAKVPLASGSGSLSFTVVPDGNGGTIVQVACFVAGTRIAVADGEAPVESLRPGDMVRTLGGRLAPVRWVGWTRVDLARHPEPARAAPVRLRAGAMGEGVPARDVLVSPEHCLLVAGALVPACMLTNGASIARDDAAAAFTYWHVELDRHDILLAEGMAAESYLDTGNRALFAGEAGVRAMHPDFSPASGAAALAVWAAQGCAPLRLTAPEQRAALWARAEALGWRLGEDAGLDIRCDGATVPFAATATGIAVRLPAGAARLRVGSRSFVPAEQESGSGDTRRLGVAAAALSLGGWRLPPEALLTGWHAPAPGEAWRWTDGDATVALPRQSRPSVLEVRLPRLGRYWAAPEIAISRPVAIRL